MKITVSVTAGPARGQSFVFEEPDCFLFGRTKDARVSLPNDPYVSRQHFLLEVSPPNCRVTDLDSKNGTFVNGVRYGGRKAAGPEVRRAPEGVNGVLLQHNDEIVVGDTRMRIDLNRDAPAEPDDVAVAETIIDEAMTNKRRTALGIPKAEQRTIQETINEGGLRPADHTEEMAPGPRPPAPPSSTVVGNRTDSSEMKTMPTEEVGEVADKPELKTAPILPGFRIESLLGQGGMGRVYKAIHLMTGKAVAIKALIPDVAQSFHNFRAFQREIEVTRQLAHPNIVALLDVGKTKGAYFCVLEFVDGTDLNSYVESRGGRLSLEELTPLMMGTLEGLGYAHRTQVRMKTAGKTASFNGIVHRDLKPANILLARRGNELIPKVADFGLSKSYESAGMTDMTMQQVAGTPAFWPREQITHYRYLDPATDVFSIAAVFYEILTGEYARPGLKEMLAESNRRKRRPDLADYMRLIGSNPIKPIREVNPGIPEPVAEVLDRALRETEVPVNEVQMRKMLAELRYADALEFRDSLGQALNKASKNRFGFE